MMIIFRRLSQPCIHHTHSLQRPLVVARNVVGKRHLHQAVLAESAAAHDIRALDLQDWVRGQRSALPHVGSELEKTQDGPDAEELEVSVLYQGLLVHAAAVASPELNSGAADGAWLASR